MSLTSKITLEYDAFVIHLEGLKLADSKQKIKGKSNCNEWYNYFFISLPSLSSFNASNQLFQLLSALGIICVCA